ncbi:MAG: class I SAM-dependent methyltransferase [Gammaproteobacteria bacterium]
MKDRDEELLSVPSAPRTERMGGTDYTGRARGRVSALERRLLAYMFDAIGNPPVQLVMWNGERFSFSRAPAIARVHIHDRSALLRLILDPELYFGDAYTRGNIEVEGDLVKFLESIYRSMARARMRKPVRKFLLRWFHRPRSTGIAEARDNIYSHYDISNSFYRLWLDENMVYTCAYFPTPGATLEDAQVAKMHHVCRKLRLQPGECVVEAGCGWGSLALFMARHYGVRVRAYNISREQIAYARRQAELQGLDARVEFVEDDYRNISGNYDAFVSVGMLEHVGQRYYRELGAVIDRVLNDDGRGLIHSIGRIQPGQMNAWIEKRIFPGAAPPSLAEMTQIFEPAGFAVLDIENLRLHYARTLEHWLLRFERARDRIEEMFDARFVRAWRLYLAGSIAAFLTSEMQLFQVVFNRGASNEVAWTRDHLYRDTPWGKPPSGEVAVEAQARECAPV